MAKKLILFLVEGITEKESFGLVFSEIFKDKEIEFEISHGDITTRNGVNTRNIIGKVNGEITSFLAKEHYKKSDIFKIVHLVDTDGAYVDNSMIEKHDEDNLYYSNQKIFASYPEKITERNEKKSRIMNRLSRTPSINNIPYNIYYLSCNLEHVLHNEANVKDNLKMELAEKFNDRFYEKANEFIDFISSEEFAVSGDYVDTWEFIKQGNNSLNRYSNFHLIFKNLNDHN